MPDARSGRQLAMAKRRLAHAPDAELRWEAAAWAKAYAKNVAKKATKKQAMAELDEITKQFHAAWRACEGAHALLRHARSVLRTVEGELAEADGALEKARIAALKRADPCMKP